MSCFTLKGKWHENEKTPEGRAANKALKKDYAKERTDTGSSDTGDKDAKMQAIDNYHDGKDGRYTIVNGVKFTLEKVPSTTKEKIEAMNGKIWNNTSTAAVETGITEMHVYSAKYVKNNQGQKGSHHAGNALDVTSIKDQNGKQHDIRRDFDDKSQSWTKPTHPVVIKQFETNFMKQSGSVAAWTPWQLTGNGFSKSGERNVVGDYSENDWKKQRSSIQTKYPKTKNVDHFYDHRNHAHLHAQ